MMMILYVVQMCAMNQQPFTSKVVTLVIFSESIDLKI